MADTQMGEDGVGREESGGEESSAPWLSQLPLGETRIFYRLQALNYVLLTLTYTQPSFHMPRVMSMLLDAICLELERSPMSPHAHADQRTHPRGARCAPATHDLPLTHNASVRTRNAPNAVYSAYPMDPHVYTRWDACTHACFPTQPSC